MPIWLSILCDRITACWLAATPVDYFRVSTLVVVTGWIVSRVPR